MGLLGKIKNIFYDEEIVEIEEKTQETKREESPRIEEVKLPKREPVKEVIDTPRPTSPIYTERELFKSEPTFKFPVIDEDDEEEPIRTRTRPNILDLERTTRREEKPKTESRFPIHNYDRPKPSTPPSHPTHKEEPVRTFKPSPVISPVYGVLDKNYKKEEIIERQHSTVRHNPNDMNYDSIRRKAYGTLEDELENTLSKISSRTDQVMQTIEEVEKLDTEANSKSIEDLLNEIEGNKDLGSVSIGEIEERIKDRMEEEESDTFVRQDDEFKKDDIDFFKKEFESKLEKKEEVPFEKEEINKEEVKQENPDEGFDKTLEHDLFNLIDSMYEEREGE